MSSVIGLLLAIFKAVPALKALWEQLLVLWLHSQIEGMKKENRNAIKKAIHDYDQRELEGLLGNPRAGEHSGLPGTELRPPRVRDNEE